MKREVNSLEMFLFNQAAKEIGLILTQSPNIAESTEIETSYGTLKRIGNPTLNPNIPPNYQRKKHVFSGKISDQPVVIIHFSGEVYGQDQDYFRRIYQNCKDVFDGQIIQFTDRKITPSLLGYDDETMTLITERAPHDLEFYFSSTNENEIKRVIRGFIDLLKHVWEKSKKENDEWPRYVGAFLEPEYPFLKGEKPEDYLQDLKVVNFYKQTQAELKVYLNQFSQSFERGFGFGDVKPHNLVEDKNGDILFIDVGKPGFYHWLSMLGQFYQGTVEKATNSTFSKVLKQEIGELLENDPNPDLAVKLFALGRINNYLLGCTLRNIVFTTEVGEPVDENTLRDTLAKVRYLTKITSPQEVIKYASDEFDSDWRERLKDYQQTPEFQENLQRLKVEIDQTLPQKKPEKKLVFVFMGIPGSGKSIIAKIIKESLHPGVILRSDWIFFEKLRDQIEDDYYKAYAYQEELARGYLQEGYSVVVDDNNRTIKNRTEVYKWAKEFGAEPILIKIKVKPEIAVKRVTIKGGKIRTEEEILNSLKAFQPQQEEAPEEKVRIIRVDGGKPLEEIKAQLEKEIGNLPSIS